jgi:hypothetical protein
MAKDMYPHIPPLPIMLRADVQPPAGNQRGLQRDAIITKGVESLLAAARFLDFVDVCCAAEPLPVPAVVDSPATAGTLCTPPNMGSTDLTEPRQQKQAERASRGAKRVKRRGEPRDYGARQEYVRHTEPINPKRADADFVDTGTHTAAYTAGAYTTSAGTAGAYTTSAGTAGAHTAAYTAGAYTAGAHTGAYTAVADIVSDSSTSQAIGSRVRTLKRGGNHQLAMPK